MKYIDLILINDLDKLINIQHNLNKKLEKELFVEQKFNNIIER